MPDSVRRRPKQPYRAPDGKCFLSGPPLEYVEALLAPRRVEEDGIFDPVKVGRVVEKFRRGRAVGVKDNMALVGVLSTQLVVDQFVRGSKEARSHADHRAAGAAVCHG